MSGADARLPISRAKSLPSLGDPKRGPSFSQAPRFGRPVSAARASSQPREPASPLGRPSQGKTGRGYKDQQRPAAPAAPAAEFKEWKAVPVTELLPSEVSKAIRRIASQTGGGVVIEMQWGSSAYLPAHNGGQKYRDCAQRLQQFISGRLSRGSPLPVHIVDKPIRFSKRCSGIYDQFSDWERAWDLVASNRSYAAGPASRLGAFEVHLVQSTWSPKLCAGKLEGDQSHNGPAVSGSWGILCSACAHRAEGHQVAGAALRTDTQEQHTLLHSKLWTRHWPDFWSVLGKIGALVIQEAPAVQRPVLLKPISFAKKQCRELRPCSFTSQQMMIGSGFPDRRPAIEQELSELIAQHFSSCSCGQWKIVGERSKVFVEEALQEHGVSSPCTVTLLWGQNGSPYKSDLDLMTWVDGTQLFYSNKQVGNCKLDFDTHAREGDFRKDPAENLSLGQTGTFVIQVTNFNDRDYADIPFKVLVRRSGQVSEAEIYDRVWKQGRQKEDPIEVCTVTVSEEDLKVKDIRLQRVQTCDYALSKCSCGHKLELHRVTRILQNHGFEGQDFENFAAELRDEWDGRDLRAFIGHFVERLQGPERESYKQREEVAQQRFLEIRDACIGEEYRIRQDYAKEFDKGQVEAEKIYAQLCLSLVRKVPEHNLDLSRLQSGEASAQEANEKLMAAIQLNEERKRKLSSWLDEVNSWRSPADVFDAILQQRPDIHRLLSGDEAAEEDALDAEITRFGVKIEEASRKYDKSDIYQSQIHQLTEKFDAQLADYVHSLGLGT